MLDRTASIVDFSWIFTGLLFVFFLTSVLRPSWLRSRSVVSHQGPDWGHHGEYRDISHGCGTYLDLVSDSVWQKSGLGHWIALDFAPQRFTVKEAKTQIR